jgi:hypothetical protein
MIRGPFVFPLAVILVTAWACTRPMPAPPSDSCRLLTVLFNEYASFRAKACDATMKTCSVNFSGVPQNFQEECSGVKFVSFDSRPSNVTSVPSLHYDSVVQEWTLLLSVKVASTSDGGLETSSLLLDPGEGKSAQITLKLLDGGRDPLPDDTFVSRVLSR